MFYNTVPVFTCTESYIRTGCAPTEFQTRAPPYKLHYSLAYLLAFTFKTLITSKLKIVYSKHVLYISSRQEAISFICHDKYLRVGI
jgi:hypothetical protein